MDGTVGHLVVDNEDSLYASGDFIHVHDLKVYHIAKWTGSAWKALGNGMEGRVNALTAWFNHLYAGGEFDQAGGVTVNGIAKWDRNTWSALGSGIGGGSAYALALDKWDNLYAGGWFRSAGGIEANNIAKWDGFRWYDLNGGIEGTVYALTCDNENNLYAGGDFTITNGALGNYIAKWEKNWSVWKQLDGGMDGVVRALAFGGTDNILYAGGDFSYAGNEEARYIAKYATCIPVNTANLVVDPSNGGRIVSDEGGIQCGAQGTDCGEAYSKGAEVRLQAVASPPWVFDAWTGDCRGKPEPECVLYMVDDHEVGALFTKGYGESPLPPHR